jgi:two-component system chemotaxis sensor kinase CheA
MELVRTSSDSSDTKIERINKTSRLMRLRDRLLPLVRLSRGAEHFAARRRGEGEKPISSSRRRAPRTFGIMVDTVFDTGEIVVKPVSADPEGHSAVLGQHDPG